MVGLAPIEAAAARDEDLLLVQQVESELFVVGDVELLHVNLREDIERGLRFHRSNTVDAVQRVVDVFTLFVNSSAGYDVIIHALVSAERGLYDGLCGNVRAQAHV